MNLSASTTTTSLIPSNYHYRLADPYWRSSMVEEFKALFDNDTWRLIP
jgi:hypothetical protein